MAIVLTTTTPVVEKFEGTRNVPYHDIVGVLTVCTGHTGSDVVVNKVYTGPECAALTEKDEVKAASGVLKVSPHLIYHPMQLAAAISFSYNVGIGGYDKSPVAADFNKGEFNQGCSALMKYTYAGGKFSQGLYNRRQQEYLICTSTLTPKGMNNVGTASNTGS